MDRYTTNYTKPVVKTLLIHGEYDRLELCKNIEGLLKEYDTDLTLGVSISHSADLCAEKLIIIEKEGIRRKFYIEKTIFNYFLIIPLLPRSNYPFTLELEKSYYPIKFNNIVSKESVIKDFIEKRKHNEEVNPNGPIKDIIKEKAQTENIVKEKAKDTIEKEEKDEVESFKIELDSNLTELSFSNEFC